MCTQYTSRPPEVNYQDVKRMLTCPAEEMDVFSDPRKYRTRARYTRFVLPYREIEGILKVTQRPLASVMMPSSSPWHPVTMHPLFCIAFSSYLSDSWIFPPTSCRKAFGERFERWNFLGESPLPQLFRCHSNVGDTETYHVEYPSKRMARGDNGSRRWMYRLQLTKPPRLACLDRALKDTIAHELKSGNQEKIMEALGNAPLSPPSCSAIEFQGGVPQNADTERETPGRSWDYLSRGSGALKLLKSRGDARSALPFSGAPCGSRNASRE